MNPTCDTLGMTGNNYKHYAIRAAEDPGYGDAVIEKIRKARNDNEIERALRTAREEVMRV